jgi:peptidoglycan/LPS O-acetylase OafA/YrhL
MNRNISDKTLQLDALDGLRGFAALMVIFSHTSNSSMFFIPYLNTRGIGKSGGVSILFAELIFSL